MEKEIDLCIRCGECCREKQWDATHSVFLRTEKCCPHLRYGWDGLFLCDTYQNRPEKVKLSNGQEFKCLSGREAAKERLLPPYCPYAQEIVNYKTKVDNYVDYDRYPDEVMAMTSMNKSYKPRKYRYIIKGK